MSIYADEGDAAMEGKLRQALRDTMGQLRDAQSQLVTVLAAQAQGEKDKADLQAKVDTLTAQLKAVSDQAAADKASADKSIADLKLGSQALVVHLVDLLTVQIDNLARDPDKNAADLREAVAGLKAQNPDCDAAIGQFGADVQLWATGYEEYVELANRTEAERAKLAAQVPVLRQTVADREAKNVALYQLASDILARYETFGLGDAVLGKEPFIGLSRVKLENLVQDYKGRLQDQVVAPGKPPAVVTSR